MPTVAVVASKGPSGAYSVSGAEGVNRVSRGVGRVVASTGLAAVATSPTVTRLVLAAPLTPTRSRAVVVRV